MRFPKHLAESLEGEIDPGWITKALCAKYDPDLAFGNEDTAKELCGFCPVRKDCLAKALIDQIEGKPVEGIWGGHNPIERSRMLRCGTALSAVYAVRAYEVELPPVLPVAPKSSRGGSSKVPQVIADRYGLPRETDLTRIRIILRLLLALRELPQESWANLAAVAKTVSITHAKIGSVLKVMERIGYVDAERCRGRVMRMEITPAGVRFHHDFAHLMSLGGQQFIDWNPRSSRQLSRSG